MEMLSTVKEIFCIGSLQIRNTQNARIIFIAIAFISELLRPKVEDKELERPQ